MQTLRLVAAAIVGAILGYLIRGAADPGDERAAHDRQADLGVQGDPDPREAARSMRGASPEEPPPEDEAIDEPAGSDLAGSDHAPALAHPTVPDLEDAAPDAEPAPAAHTTGGDAATLAISRGAAPELTLAQGRPPLALALDARALIVPGGAEARARARRPDLPDDDDAGGTDVDALAGAPVASCDRTANAPPPSGLETCLSTTLGEPVWRGTLSAASPSGMLINAPEACDYLLVVSGVFAYSSTGRQDALRRWHDPLVYDFEPLCTGCGVDELEALVAFVIDDKPRRPIAECPLASTYVYHVVPEDGAVHVAINDYSVSFSNPRYDDNTGGLELALYTVASDHELVTRYADPSEAFGVPLGTSLGVQHLGFTPGATPILMLLSFPDLATFAREVSWPTRPDRRYLLDVRGFYTAAPGVEADALFMWPPLTMSSWPITLEGCSHLLVGTDAYAHRSTYDLSGCGPTLVVRTPQERPAGVIAVELFEQ